MNDPQQRTSLSGSGALAEGEGAQAVGARGVLAGNVSGSIVTGTQIINNYYTNGGQQPDRERLVAQIASYLKWVQAQYGRIELRGIERGGRKVLTLDLNQAYVALEATVTAPVEERSGLLGLVDRLRGARSKSRQVDLLEDAQTVKAPIDLDDVLGLGNQLVVTGAPGCGKTTLLLHIAWALATAIQAGSDLAKDRLGLERPLPLPIFVPLAAYARHARPHPRGVHLGLPHRQAG